MAVVTTKLENLINPEVMADMISAKAEQGVKIMPYAKVDTTLQGQAGDTVTLPKFSYIGDAVEVAEGEEIPTRQMGVTSAQYTIKKIGIGGVLTDEAVLSGYGNPVGELTNQMSRAIVNKCDFDAIDELYKATTSYVGTDVVSYETVVNAIDLFEEEVNSEKVMFIHPKQMTQIRLDSNFLSADKYGNTIAVKGEVGMICNTRVVPSKKVKLQDGYYLNPIVKLSDDKETEDESPAITVYLKRDTNVERFRNSGNRTTEITGDKMYVVALTNEEKVVIAKCLAEKASV